MKWDEVRDRWVQVKGDVQKTWDRLSDEDIERISGKRDLLEDLIHKRYGLSKEEARKQVDRWQHCGGRT